MALKLLLPTLVLVALAAHHSNSAAVKKYQAQWSQHMATYGLSFESSSEEETHYANFEANVEQITEWNSNPNHTFKLGLNKFSHLSQDFIKSKILMPSKSGSRHGSRPVRGTTTTTTTPKPVALNSNVNWTSKFVAIKDQGYCGSCFAFAATGVVEAAYAIKHSKTISLSEEQILDCTMGRLYQNLACGGGDSEEAFAYANSSPLYSETDYPYLSYNDQRTRPVGSCHTVSSPTMTPVGVASYGIVSPTTENAVAAFVQTNGPVVAYVDASHPSFSNYLSGVYSEPRCSTTNTDHAVIIVGFGTTSAGQDYWIIRNSWGTSWGMNGYMLMARNAGGMCGIVSENIYATVN